MPIRGTAIRECYRSNRTNPAKFVAQFYEDLGLQPRTRCARICTDDEGKVNAFESSKQKIRPDSISFLELAQAIISPHADVLQNTLTDPEYAQAPWRVPHEVSESTAMEAEGATGAIVPSQFANISAFNAAAIGLLEAKMLEAYQSPEFLADGLVDHFSDNLRQTKMIGVSNVGDLAQLRNPGMPHARVDLSERYVTTPTTYNRGLSVVVTAEAALFDRTGQLMRQAESVGNMLRYRKEMLILDIILGITNSYNYNGTDYYTYQSVAYDTAGGNFVNSFANPVESANSWEAYNNVLQKWVSMVDPDTGLRINIGGDRSILCMPANYALHETALQATNIARFAGALNTYFAKDMATSPPPSSVTGMFKLIGSPVYPYAYQRVTDSDGLNLSSTAATGIWYAGNFKKAFHWHENIPLTTVRATANDFIMADHRVILGLFADEMGAPGVTDPRYVIRCKYASGDIDDDYTS